MAQAAETIQRGRRLFLPLAGLAILCMGPSACVYRWRLGHTPRRLGVWRILYASERAAGFGPGGNEAGVLVYELPARAAERIARGGAAYLDRLTAGERRRDGWFATPVTVGDWLETTNLGAEPRPPGYRPRLADYLDQYGFGVPVEAAVHRLADAAMQAAGAFYAYNWTGGGMILVIPARRRVVFAYAR